MKRGVRSHFRGLFRARPLQVMTVTAAVAATAAAAAPLRRADPESPAESLFVQAARKAAEAVAEPGPAALRLVWEGADVDADGKADFMNPTGQAPRLHDAYGEGEFGATRDGGSRRHEGVDFRAEAGQSVVAPISGYVTKIGYAYPGDRSLKFVEISNPALRYAARVFYVNPKVEVGETVAVGDLIGVAKSLQRKYPRGMTNHVHLELMDAKGDRFDAAQVITRQYAAD